MSDHDIGGPESSGVSGVSGHELSGLEGRIRELFGDGSATRPLSAAVIIDGARRRRVRRRMTAAGSSLAVLGVAAAAVAFGGRGAGTVTPTTPVPKTCSASVTGPAPARTVSVDDQGHGWDTFSGVTAGIPWAMQLHSFATEAAIRIKGEQGWTTVPMKPGGTVSEFFNSTFDHVGSIYLGGGWVDPRVGHLCVQYEGRAQFVAVLNVQSGTFAFFGVDAAAKPKALIAYDVSGREVARQRVLMYPPDGFFFVG